MYDNFERRLAIFASCPGNRLRQAIFDLLTFWHQHAEYDPERKQAELWYQFEKNFDLRVVPTWCTFSVSDIIFSVCMFKHSSLKNYLINFPESVSPN